MLLAQPLPGDGRFGANYLGNGLGKPAEEENSFTPDRVTALARSERVPRCAFTVAQAFCDVVVHVLKVAQRIRTEIMLQ